MFTFSTPQMRQFSTAGIFVGCFHWWQEIQLSLQSGLASLVLVAGTLALHLAPGGAMGGDQGNVPPPRHDHQAPTWSTHANTTVKYKPRDQWANSPMTIQLFTIDHSQLQGQHSSMEMFYHQLIIMANGIYQHGKSYQPPPSALAVSMWSFWDRIHHSW